MNGPAFAGPSSSSLRFDQGIGDQASRLPQYVDRAARMRLPHLLTEADGVICCGVGTSAVVADVAASALRSAGVPAVSLGVSAAAEMCWQLGWPILAVSRSGRSIDLLDLFAHVPPDKRVALTFAPTSPLATQAAETIDLGRLADSRTSTVGFTTMLMVIGGLVDSLRGNDTRVEWENLALEARRVANVSASFVGESARRIGSSEHVDIVGDQVFLPAARYGAHVLRQVARTATTAIDTRSYLHGAIESSVSGSALLVGGDRLARVGEQLAADGRSPVFWRICADPRDPDGLVLSCPGLYGTLRLPFRCHPSIRPIGTLLIVSVLLQKLSATISHSHGIDPDQYIYRQHDISVA